MSPKSHFPDHTMLLTKKGLRKSTKNRLKNARFQYLEHRSKIEGRVSGCNGGQNLVDFQQGQQNVIFLPAK